MDIFVTGPVIKLVPSGIMFIMSDSRLFLLTFHCFLSNGLVSKTKTERIHVVSWIHTSLIQKAEKSQFVSEEDVYRLKERASMQISSRLSCFWIVSPCPTCIPTTLWSIYSLYQATTTRNCLCNIDPTFHVVCKKNMKHWYILVMKN